MDSGTIQENTWYPLSEIFEQVAEGQVPPDLEHEIRLKATQLKRDLGLRMLPLLIEQRNGTYCLRASGIVGTLRFQSRNVQIIPKFLAHESHLANWQTAILRLLERAHSRHYSYTRNIKTTLQSLSFLDHVAQAYCDALESALDKEPIHVYRIRNETTPYLRGRLAITRQLQSLFQQPHLLECEVDYLETDNLFNHLLHWACDRFSTLALDGGVRRRISNVSVRLPVISRPPKIPLTLPLVPPPQYTHYADALEIASLLARGFGQSQAPGRYAGYGYVLNTERLYEKFIERSVPYALHLLGDGQYKARSQVTRIYAQSLTPNSRSYYTRPDNMVFYAESPRLLIDAKYKLLADAEEGTPVRPQNSDVYQAFASLVSHNCDRALLVYPRLLSDRELGDGKLRLWSVKSGQGSLLVGAVSLDLGMAGEPGGLQKVDEALAEIIRAMLGAATH